MSGPRSDWSYAPETRPGGPAGGSIAAIFLAVVIVALLGTGVTGVAIHHRSVATPDGYQRLVDRADHLSLAVPGSWQVPTLTAGRLSNEIQGLKTADPQVTALADLALATLQKVQLGVFALDAATKTVLFTYGADDPGARTVDPASTAQLITELDKLGAKNVQATKVHLPLGTAEQVSAQVTVAAMTVSELLDVLVAHDRVVVIVLAVRAGQPPTSLLRKINSTLAPA